MSKNRLSFDSNSRNSDDNEERTQRLPSIQRRSSSNYQRLNSSEFSINDDDNEPLLAQRQPSLILPHLQTTEKRFFELVHAGNVNAVKDFLNEQPGFNINCVNFQGVSALHIAIEIKSEQMVQFLLSQETIDVGDSALHAVKENLSNVLEMILNHLESVTPGLEFAGYTGSSDYADHITPLILAAQCGHYEIIEMLIERGHRINKPHLPNCICEKCREQFENDDLLHAETRRLNLFRAVSSPAYICHSSHDPILASFLLSSELRTCATLEPEFRTAYLELSEEVSQFAVDLISYCRSTEEMELVLKQHSNNNSTGDADNVQFIFPRLVLAMDHKQKQFVSHPNTQQIISTTWHGNWHSWKKYNIFIRIFLIIIRIFMLPGIAFMSLAMPFHSMTKKFALPVNKLISHSASYVLFLVFIFLQSNLSKRGQDRGPPHSGLEPFIVLYVFGFIWSTIRMAVLQGPIRYFRMMWSWYEFVMLFLFINTFLFWLAALGERKGDSNLERKYWHYLDPTLIAEGMFACATIMAFFRLLLLCQLDYNLGPLQISLGKMAVDIGKFTLIFTIIIIAFTAGLCRLYHYYEGMVQVDEASGIKTVQIASFTDFEHTLKTLFWALFCMAPLESADVIIENLPGDADNITVINKHLFTEAVGYITFACFEVLCVIIILNMLIATMSNTFQRVTDNVDIEWTFGRTQVYMQYMLQTTLPPPYNLIPTYNGVLTILDWIRLTLHKESNRRARWSLMHCCYIESDVDIHISREFPVLMSQLVQRYFRDKITENQDNEIDALRQEIIELKMMFQDLGSDKHSN